MTFHRLRPIPLALALICFCLPWLELRCNDPGRGEILTTQSGLQMVYGGTTTTVNGEPVSEADRQQHSATAGDRERPVPLVILYLAALLTALVTSLVVADSGWRWTCATVASGLAAAVLVIQIALGFPLVNELPRGAVGWIYTPWFWLALAFTLAAPMLSVGERLRPPTRPPTDAKPTKSAAIRLD